MNKKSAVILLAWVSAATLALPVYATLGENFSPGSIQAKSFKATRAANQKNYTVNEYTLGASTVVRELTSPSNKVFAVFWHGPLKPDLRQLLGTHFDRYLAAANSQPDGVRQPLSVNEAGLVVNVSGRVGAFSGVAYLPDQIPAGVTLDELQQFSQF